MKLVFDPAQRAHGPPFQFADAEKRPHVESPARIDAILGAQPDAERVTPLPISRDALLRVHDADYVTFLETAYAAWVSAGHAAAAIVPSSFRPPGTSGRPRDIAGLAGWYCRDTYTPICERTFSAACASASSAVYAANLVLEGERAVYALCRPPGHHAGRDYCGGFCYLNNAALAAEHLRAESGGRVAILDIDYHHGNGTQDIFYESEAVAYVSIHADPALEFPYYSGHASETGTGRGLGSTHNFPLAPGAGEAKYRDTLMRALESIQKFRAETLVISFGADVCAGDPEGSFELAPGFLGEVARAILALGIPAAIIQDGGYALDILGAATAEFLRPFAEVAEK